MKKEHPKTRGWLAAIRESMAKTGGCCGPGESCCGPAKEEDKEAGKDKDSKRSVKDVKK